MTVWHAISKAAALVWLLLIIVWVCVAWQHGPQIDTDMMSLLPASEQQPLVQAAAQQSGAAFAQRLLVLLSGEDNAMLMAAVKQVAARYARLPEVDSVLWKIDETTLAETRDALANYRYVLLADTVRDRVQQGDFATIRQRALAEITSPTSSGTQSLTADPFGLFNAWQSAQQPKMQIRFDDGLMAVGPPENARYLVIINLAAQAFSLPVQQAIYNELDALDTALAQQNIQIVPSGLLVHAHAGAEQAKQETSTIGLGSLCAIVAIMLWVFRRTKLLVMLLLPVIVGGIMASATVFLLFEKVHLVTFAFGAGLIGVSIDYALHFICERQQNSNALKRIKYGLILGLGSSVLAYAALAMTPFPGLRQMAVFSVIGLIAAWLTVVLWFPFLMRDDPTRSLVAMQYLPKVLKKMPYLSEQRGLQLGLAGLLIVAIAVLGWGRADDDLRLLQTSPPELMQQEQSIQSLLGLESGTQFLLLSCTKPQYCLQQEEAIKPLLRDYQQHGVLKSFSLLASQLPSLQRQQENAALTTELYQRELATLFSTLSLPESAQQQARQSMKMQVSQRLSVDDVANKSILADAIKQKLVMDGKQYGTIVGLSAAASAQLPQAIEPLLSAYPDIVFVDNVATISNLLKDYRQHVMLWISLAYLLIFSVLLWRYKAAALRVILPPLFASIFTLALLMLTLPGINLFHVMALILVLGIGLDMGIFLNETRQDKATWLAVSLSVLTSLIAFGLLALSQTPILRHFGITVLCGLVCVWALALLMRPLPEGQND